MNKGIILKKIATYIVVAIVVGGIAILIGNPVNAYLGWLFNAFDFVESLLGILFIVSLILGIVLMTSIGSFIKRHRLIGAVLIGLSVAFVVNHFRYEFSQSVVLSPYYKTYSVRHGDCILMGCKFEDNAEDKYYNIGYYMYFSPAGKPYMRNSKTAEREVEKSFYGGPIFPAINKSTGEKLVAVLNIGDKEDDEKRLWHIEVYNTKGELQFIYPKDKIEWQPFIGPLSTDLHFTYMLELFSKLLQDNDVYVDPDQIESVRYYYTHRYL